jgi:hypothetical protein
LFLFLKGGAAMNKSNMTALFKNIKMAVSKHSPEILTGVGIAGMITTTILAVRATPKALDLIAEAEEKKFNDGNEERLTRVEIVKAAWKPYVLPAITGVVSASCLIGANSVNAKRHAALATMCNLTSTAFTEFKEATLETVGEKKEQAIRRKVAEERIKKEPVNPSTIVVSGTGNTRCFDTITKRRFISDIESIKKIVNELNRRMINGEDYISLNEFYYELGLDGVNIGDELGWNVTRGLIEVDFSAQLDTDGVPCVVVDYMVVPKRGFNNFS